uniref:7TM_GPCR_Srx domain-containing protein n=1 Tax=Steinernema glaseri TaxID=37863 RepID=A0A1I7Z9X4_9BILA
MFFIPLILNLLFCTIGASLTGIFIVNILLDYFFVKNNPQDNRPTRRQSQRRQTPRGQRPPKETTRKQKINVTIYL